MNTVIFNATCSSILKNACISNAIKIAATKQKQVQFVKKERKIYHSALMIANKACTMTKIGEEQERRNRN